jgi:hypothetical protein
MDIEKIGKAITKFIDVFILKGTDIDYSATVRKTSDRDRFFGSDRIVIDMDVDVDVSKILVSHPNYDRDYANKLYNLYDKIAELVPKSIGLKEDIFHYYLSHTYINDNFIHYEMQELVENINKILPEYGYDEDVEIWGNIYLASDENIYIKAEFGNSGQDYIKENDFNNIINELVYKTNDYPYIRELINDSDYEFFND